MRLENGLLLMSEPKEPKIFAMCSCGDAIDVGDDCLEYDGDYYHDTDCLLEYMEHSNMLRRVEGCGMND